MGKKETGKDSKLHIKVRMVGTPQEVGANKVLKVEFTGHDNITYEALGKQLIDVIKESVEFEADITHSEFTTDAGVIYYHHTVTQIYIDGQPIKKQGGGGYGYKGKSPEEQASIEVQVAIKEIGEALRAKVNIPDALPPLYWAWITNRLTQSPTTTVETPSQRPESVSSDTSDIPVMKNMGDFRNACAKLSKKFQPSYINIAYMNEFKRDISLITMTEEELIEVYKWVLTLK